MNVICIIAGYVTSTVGGAIVLWLVIDKLTWGWLVKKGIRPKEQRSLTMFLGIVERSLYTTAFLLNQPGFVAVWLALKVASRWKRWEEVGDRATYNLFLIGSGLSLIMAYVGAWVVAGDFPLSE